MAAVAVALVGAFAILLIVPVHVELECDTQQQPPKRRVQVLVRWWILSWRSAKTRPTRPRSGARDSSRPTPADPARWRSVLVVLGSQGFAARVGRLVIELLHALAPRSAEGQVRFGFEDPVSTGAVFGLAHGAAVWARAAGWRVQLEPEFGGPAFVAHVRIEWALRPGRVLWPVGTFIASPTAWRAAVAAVRGG